MHHPASWPWLLPAAALVHPWRDAAFEDGYIIEKGAAMSLGCTLTFYPVCLVPALL
jgi:hypothetical protein